jgi:hypothetical protein
MAESEVLQGNYSYCGVILFLSFICVERSVSPRSHAMEIAWDIPRARTVTGDHYTIFSFNRISNKPGRDTLQCINNIANKFTPSPSIIATMYSVVCGVCSDKEYSFRHYNTSCRSQRHHTPSSHIFSSWPWNTVCPIALDFQPIHTTGNSTPDNQGALPNIRKGY